VFVPATTLAANVALAQRDRGAKAAQQPLYTVAMSAPPSCRQRCGACCIAPSITSPIPGMPNGKPAGVPCVQLDERLRCRLFGTLERPAFCNSLRPSADMCGNDRIEALTLLGRMEIATAPRAVVSPSAMKDSPPRVLPVLDEA